VAVVSEVVDGVGSSRMEVCGTPEGSALWEEVARGEKVASG
jgi:hypothetical protein